MRGNGWGCQRKNLVVVPNQILGEFEAAHRYLYPEDAICVVYPEDFGPRDRQEVLERIRDGEFTAIYMAFSSFGLIPLGSAYKLEKQQGYVSRLSVLARESVLDWREKEASESYGSDGGKTDGYDDRGA